MGKKSRKRRSSEDGEDEYLESGNRRLPSVRDAVQALVRRAGLTEHPPRPAINKSGGKADATVSTSTVEDEAGTSLCEVETLLVPPFETFLGDHVPRSRLQTRLEERLREGHTLLGRVKAIDAVGARVKLICGETRRSDWRELDVQVIVPIPSLGRRPQIGDVVRVRVESARPLRCCLEETMDPRGEPLQLPDYIIEEETYSEWTEGLQLMRNRHAEQAVNAAGRATTSLLSEVHIAEEELQRRTLLQVQKAGDLVAKGVAAMRSGERDEAWNLLREATEVHPTSADAYVALGALLVNDGRPSEAEKYFQRALGFDPRHRNAILYYKQILFGMARVHEKESRWQEAMECYEKALAQKLDEDEAKRGVETCREKMNERSKRSPSVEEIPPPASSAASSVSGNRRKSSASGAHSANRKESRKREESQKGASLKAPEKAPPVLKKDERKRLSDLEALHAMLKSEAGK